jgi:hypothetical protein
MLRVILGDLVLVMEQGPREVDEELLRGADTQIGSEPLDKSRDWLLSAHLRTNAERVYSIAIQLNDIGVVPILLARDTRVYIGAEEVVGCVDVGTRECCWQRNVETTVQDLICLGSDLLVVGEIGVERLQPDGSSVWRNDTDLIDDYELGEDGVLFVHFVDDPPVVMDIASGRTAVRGNGG